MPKVKVPYTITHDKNGWYIKIGNAKLYSVDSLSALIACVIANEAYAHGHRNGMRAGRKG